MPFAIDEDEIKTKLTLDLGKPPVKSIPHADYPRMIYMHPKSPTRIHREIILGQWVESVVLNEHKIKVVENEKEFAQALKAGWSKDPYVPQAPAMDEEVA